MKTSALISTLSLAAFLSGSAAASGIVNGNFQSGNQGFTSEYNFVPSCGQFGVYMISDNPAAVCPGNWVSFGDHTTGSGLMMIVDGARQPGRVIWSETVTIAPDTNYAFRFYSASADPESDTLGGASIQTTINGANIGTPLRLGSYDGWHRKTVLWNSGANSSATISLIDLKHRAAGNDFVLDDIRLRVSRR